MKKTLLLLLTALAFVFTSCSSDDDSSPSQDAFIGTWKYVQYFEDGVEYPLAVCEDEDTLEVRANGTLTFTLYDANMDGECVSNFESTGPWENIGEGVYAIDADDVVVGNTNVTFSGNRVSIETTDDGIIFTDVYEKQ
jgi:hypothetical protein